MTIERKELGKKGENYAKLYLQRKQFQIVEQNWKCRSGELDLIATYKNHLVFIEVRTRTKPATSELQFGFAEESVNYRKQMKLQSLAQIYIHQKKLENINVRFDVIVVYVERDHQTFQLKHYENAF